VNNDSIHCGEKQKIQKKLKLLFMLSRVEGAVQRLHFQFFRYIINLFFQHDHANIWDLFLSSTDGYICINHNHNQSGKGV